MGVNNHGLTAQSFWQATLSSEYTGTTPMSPDSHGAFLPVVVLVTVTSAGVREKEDLSYKEWAKRLDLYYQALERMLWPDLFVVGGGVSKNHDQFLPLLHLRTPIIPAGLRNRAGIVGAAWAAAHA